VINQRFNYNFTNFTEQIFQSCGVTL